MLNRIKIIHKVYFLGASLLFLILLVGFIGLKQMQDIGNEIIDIAEIDMPLTNKLTEITEHQLAQVIELERSVLYGVLAQTNAKKKDDMMIHVDKMKKISLEIEHELVEADEILVAGLGIAHTQEGIDKLNSIQAQMLTINEHFKVTEHESFEVADLMVAGNVDAALKILPTLEKHQDQLDKELIDTLHDIQVFTANAALKAEHDEKTAINQIATVLICSVIFAIIIPILVGRSISKPIKNLQDRLIDITKGEGDLTQRINSPMQDEIGTVSKYFDRFVDQLATSVRNIAHSSVELEKSSNNSLRIIEDTQNAIRNQQGETSTVSSAISEMNTATQEVAINTASAAEIAETVKNSVEKGKRSADETQEIIREMADEVTRTSKDIETLAKETESIGTVLDAIRGIAEQTNLLALNAAIEAARAGETGRGFAVVADEVRSLAQRTQESTVDIQELVEKLQREASQAVSSMQNGNTKTEACLAKSTETSHSFEEAYEAVSRISDLNTQIAAAVEEQSQVTAEITNNLQNIQDISVSTTEGAEQATASNQQITQQVIELNNNIHQFKV
ncbi:methyl-accepting chemotaxis protein [Marinomonas sp. MED121]|uniref:methyl-accepting chemotaxis protein n=1 Tax=Marinomonas sp. MED121 TaxID=314277 RepID=UPI0000690EEC|nr:methyl-accepting chemotaxis protein [Marinomonas sp. MED121]EAQ64278.1 methyl-accepting chemotaxis protein [Marinomonas sp. MED121]